MNIEAVTVEIDKVRQAERNVRKHPKKQIEALKESYELFGQYRPLVVDSDGVILVGNGMHRALKELGVPTVEVKYLPPDFPEDMKKKLMLADNKTQSIGFDDLQVVEEFISELSDFDIPGFDSDILEDLYGDDDPLDDYGVLPQERVAQISTTAERREDEPPMTKQEITEKLEPRADLERPEINAAELHSANYITCPNCGMKIWQ